MNSPAIVTYSFDPTPAELMLAALQATVYEGHYERCLRGLRGAPPDDAMCYPTCVQVRAAIAAGASA